jgi:outer membrane protein assembly factor BamB
VVVTFDLEKGRRMTFALSSCIAVLVAVVATGCTVAAEQPAAANWPQWRGPNRDGSTGSLPAPSTWPAELTLKWKADVGLGYATPIVVDNRVYVHSRRGDNEVVAALDADTGKEIWTSAYPAPYKVIMAAAPHGPGPKATPVYADGRVFTFGISGILSAFDAGSGELLWRKPEPAIGPTYGTTTSPLVEGDLLIVHVGGHDNGALSAFDVRSGEARWQWTGDGPGYGSPIVADLGGVRQVVTLTQENIVGVAAASGELLWRRPFRTPTTANALTPLVFRDTVIISGQEQGVQALRPVRRGNAWVVEQAWINHDIWFHLSNPAVIGGTIVALSPQSRGQYVFVDAATGSVLWSGPPRAANNAAILSAGDWLLILEDDGELVLADVKETGGLTPVRRYRVAQTDTWAQPSISGRRIFIKDVSSVALWTM